MQLVNIVQHKNWIKETNRKLFNKLLLSYANLYNGLFAVCGLQPRCLLLYLSLSQSPITIIIQLMLKTAMAFTSD